MDEPTGPLASARQRANLDAIGKVISEAQNQLRGGQVDPELLKSLGMTRDQFAAFVDRYAQRIGKIEKMRDETERPEGAIRGAFSLGGSDRKASGSGVDDRLTDLRGGEKLTIDQIRKLHQQRARNVSPEYRAQVEAYFRAISEQALRDGAAAPTTQPGK